jgi:hypothetical protein
MSGKPFVFRDRSDVAFGTTSDNSTTVYPSSLDAPSARARLLFLLLLFAIQKRKERPTSSERTALLSSAIVPATPSERPQNKHLHFTPSSLDVEKPKKNP